MPAGRMWSPALEMEAHLEREVRQSRVSFNRLARFKWLPTCAFTVSQQFLNVIHVSTVCGAPGTHTVNLFSTTLTFSAIPQKKKKKMFCCLTSCALNKGIRKRRDWFIDHMDALFWQLKMIKMIPKVWHNWEWKRHNYELTDFCISTSTFSVSIFNNNIPFIHLHFSAQLHQGFLKKMYVCCW